MNNTCGIGCDHYQGNSNKQAIEIRVLPSGGESNILCCKTHYITEIEFRKERNKQVWKKFDLPLWENLIIYNQGE